MARGFGKTIVQQAQAVHTATFIVLHGMGDTGEGWAFLGPELKLQHVKWVYPTAPTRPITLNGGISMPGWFDLDALGNVESMLAGKLDHKGIEESVAYVKEIIAGEVAAGVPLNRIMVLGFSQGGHIALKTALGVDGNIAGCIALSTWLNPIKTEIDSQKKSIPIFIGHGDADPMLPVLLGTQTSKMLKGAGMTDVTFKTYPGLAHSSCPEELNDVKEFILKVVPESAECAVKPTKEEISTMTVKQLKGFLVKAGVDISDCIEKADLISRAMNLL